MKLISCFLRNRCAWCMLISCFLYTTLVTMDHYEKLIIPYCNYYKLQAKLEENESKEYIKHFTLQCTHGGHAFHCLYNKKTDALKLNSPEQRLSVLCRIICFFYRQGLTENTDPEKNGLYEVDFHINDPKKKFYKTFVEKYGKEVSKKENNEKTKKLINEYEAEFVHHKKVKFYELAVPISVEKKPRLPLGHQYIRIYHDAEKEKIHIRTMPHSYYTFSNGFSYLKNKFIDKRDAGGYKKIHICKSITKDVSQYFFNEQKSLGDILKKLETTKEGHEYENELEGCIKNINKRYRYPKELYGNEVYIDSRDLIAMVAYLDYLKVIHKNNDAEDFADIIKPFLILDEIIFNYNNFQKFTLNNEIYSGTDELRNYVKETVMPLSKSVTKLMEPHKTYTQTLLKILDLILISKHFDTHLLYSRIFDSHEHKKIIKKLENEQSYKKNEIFKLENNTNNSENKIQEEFSSLQLSLNKEINKDNDEKSEKTDKSDEKTNDSV